MRWGGAGDRRSPIAARAATVTPPANASSGTRPLPAHAPSHPGQGGDNSTNLRSGRGGRWVETIDRNTPSPPRSGTRHPRKGERRGKLKATRNPRPCHAKEKGKNRLTGSDRPSPTIDRKPPIPSKALCKRIHPPNTRTPNKPHHPPNPIDEATIRAGPQPTTAPHHAHPLTTPHSPHLNPHRTHHHRTHHHRTHSLTHHQRRRTRPPHLLTATAPTPPHPLTAPHHRIIRTHPPPPQTAPPLPTAPHHRINRLRPPRRAHSPHPHPLAPHPTHTPPRWHCLERHS